MNDKLLDDRDVSFLLYELLDTGSLPTRPRYEEHSRETFDATMDTAKKIAAKFFATHNAKADTNEPRLDGDKVQLVPETKVAWDAFAEAGFLGAHFDFKDGGLQLPEVIMRAAMAYFNAANISSTAYGFLTIGAANLINSFANDEQKKIFLPPMQDGRFAGTMALTEPGQGSALADIKTYAELQEDGTYRIFGNKMFISGGDQSLTENIVHLVLARIKGAPPGVKGISLFICPKFLVKKNGSVGKRNDVRVAGLLHKMGYRNSTSTMLNFGENEGAVGFLVGEPHNGLFYMFQMMNEARIGVGLGAASLAYQGFNYSLNYARQRLQGRLPSNKDAASKQIPIIEHADVRRMLLAQKAYAEGGLAMCLYASSLFEDSHTAPTEDKRRRAFLLLDLITPVIKSWPSKYGLKANDLAIQVLGGSGYAREYPVEQYYRDQRLNPIHEGTEAIHGLDLLGRRVTIRDGAGYLVFKQAVQQTLEAATKLSQTNELAAPLCNGMTTLDEVTQVLVDKMDQDADLALANATIYLDLFGCIVAAWIWLKQALVAAKALSNDCSLEDQNFYQGKLQTARYFFEWELPQIAPQADLLKRLDRIPLEMKDAWFGP